MKRHILLTSFFLSSLLSLAQQWEKVFPPLSGMFFKVSFVNDTTGFITGDDGGIAKTIDGGNSWARQSNNSPALMTSIDFVDASVGYAVGDVLYKTTNGGSNWSPVTTCTIVNPRDVYFTSADTGFISTYSGIWRSVDAGVNWSYSTGTNSGDLLCSISFPSKDTGYVVGDYWKILRTINGGNTWTYQTAPTSPGYYDLKSTVFVNNNLGFAVGTGGVILKTVNAGITWNVMTSGTALTLYSIYFSNALEGYIAGENGLILKTTNGGVSWNIQSNAGTSDLFSIAFSTSGNGIAVGENATILKTSDSGLTWTPMTEFVVSQFNGVAAVNATDAYAVGTSGTILKTQDNGSTWTQLNTGTTKAFNATFFVSATEGYAVGDSGTVMKTINSGTTWLPLTTPAIQDFNDVQFTDLNTGYITGGYFFAPDTSQNIPGKVYKTTDAGVTWTQILSVPGVVFKSIHFPVTDTGYVVGGDAGGYASKIYKTINGGVTWVDQTGNQNMPGQELSSVHFVNTTTGFISGISGAIYKTVNGGTNWIFSNALSQISGDEVNAIYFKTPLLGYAAFVGYVLNTQNGGLNWTAQSPSAGVGNRFRSIDFTSDHATGYAVGTNGNIIRYTDTTVAVIWPGDADANNVVDNNDMLPLGLHYGETGTPRATVSNSWQAYVSANWANVQSNGENINHADCNGDGTINANDTLAINLNMNQNHAMASQSVLNRTAGDIYFVTSSASYLPGTWVDAEIWMGTSANPISNLYGIAFNINFDAAQIQTGTASLNYPASWLGSVGTNAISFAKTNVAANTEYGALTRIDHLNASGYGKIATFRFQTRTDISSNTPMNFSISGYQADDAAGAPVTFATQPYTIAIDPNTVGLAEELNSAALTIYPNPYSGSTQISYSFKERSEVNIEVFNMLGQHLVTLVNEVQSGGEYKIEFSAADLGFSSGIYYVKFIANGRTSTCKIVEMK
jgi:photosystem II stability/assembly factor-like uncharacterized protein